MKTIIFDFDGTIADTLSLVIDIYHKINRQAVPFTPEEVERLRGMTFLQIARELRIPPWRVPGMLVRGRSLMRKHLDEVKIFEGIEALIRDLHKEGVPLIIMSTNSASNIRKFLRGRQLDEYFVKVHGGIGVFGKARALKKIMEHDRLDPSNVYYVGDEIRDVEAAKKAGVHSVAVTWGYNNETLLATHEPFALVSTPAQLRDVFRDK